jgi:hypothetical protein
MVVLARHIDVGDQAGCFGETRGCEESAMPVLRKLWLISGRAQPGRRARIQERRSRGLSSVKGTDCSMRAKYSSSSVSARARVALGAPQFTDAMASSTAMKARAILAAYSVEVMGVVPLDEFRN